MSKYYVALSSTHIMEVNARYQQPLDESQQKFCSDTDKNLRLLAPAGSGKTHSILWRCLNQYQIHTSKNDTDAHFLIITFTKPARDELSLRIKSDPVFKPIQSVVKVSTLNSLGYRTLKSSNRHGFKYQHISPDDYYRCLYNTLRPCWTKYPELEGAIRSYNTSNIPFLIMELINKLKNLGFRHDIHSNYQNFCMYITWLLENDLENQIYKICEELSNLEIIPDLESIDDWGQMCQYVFNNFFLFWCEACEDLHARSQFTYEDQKYWTLILLEKRNSDPEKKAKGKRFDHILVDEFQDISILDLNFLRELAKHNGVDITVIGDDDQAIYEWRAATPEIILNPQKYLGKDYRTYTLEYNYRCPRNVVVHSQELIKNNSNRVDKTVIPHSLKEADIKVETLDTLNDSVEYVLDILKGNLNENRRKIAIIGRKRSQIIPYQIAFARENIPFYAAEDLQIFLSRAFRDLRDILVACSKAGDSQSSTAVVEALLKICDKIKKRPISNEERRHLKRYLLELRPRTLLQATEHLYNYRGSLKQYSDGRTAATYSNIIYDLLNSASVSEAIDFVSENFEGLKKDYGMALTDIFYTEPPFIFLSEYAAGYGEDFTAFCEDLETAEATLALFPSDDESEAMEGQKASVHLMTALRAKGKEFDTVIILDANDEIWPSYLAESVKDLEQERRLFYVGVTRAKERLILLVNRCMLGNPVSPSRFLYEMGLL